MSNNAKKTLKNIGKPLDNIKKMFRELGTIQKNWQLKKDIKLC